MDPLGHGLLPRRARRATTVGIALQLYTCNGTVAQQWTLNNGGEVTNPHSKLCLDVKGASSANNTPLILATCGTAITQRWDASAMLPSRGLVSSGVGAVNQFCLTDAAGGLTAGTPFELVPCSYTAAQPTVAGQTITHVGAMLQFAGGCMTAAATKIGAAVTLQPCMGHLLQLWDFGPNGRVYNAGAKMCLDDPHSTKVSGTHLWDLHLQRHRVLSSGPFRAELRPRSNPRALHGPHLVTGKYVEFAPLACRLRTYPLTMTWRSCCRSSRKLSIRYLEGRGADHTWSAPRIAVLALVLANTTSAVAASSVNYVALGDSYSSGVGAGSYTSASGSCDRSTNAASQLWANAHAPAAYTSVACSGAKTTDVTSTQLSALSTATTLVSITIGGNDVNFSGVMEDCVLYSTSTCVSEVNTAEANARSQLPGLLNTVYNNIRSHAPNAKVVVMGYPEFYDLSQSSGCVGLSTQDRTAIDQGSDLIDSIISTAVGSHSNFVYEDVRSHFVGHQICDSNSWMHSTNWLDLDESYHPTAAGQSGAYLPEHLTKGAELSPKIRN